jgi:acyl carrier protein
MINQELVRTAARHVTAQLIGYQVSDTDSLVSSGLIDSLSVLDLIAGLEQQLSLRIVPDTLQPEDFDSISLIVETVTRVSA